MSYISGFWDCCTLFYIIILLSLFHHVKSEDTKSLCRGKPAGKYPDSLNCGRYLQCFGTIQFMTNCPTGHYFEKRTFKCEPAADFPCSANRHAASLIGTRCHVEGEIIPSAMYCERFMVCRGGSNSPIYCPPGLIFSNKAWKCIPTPDPCKPRPPHQEKEIVKREKSPYLDICEGKMFQNVSDPIHCSAFIACMLHQHTNTSIVFTTHCESGNLFSNETSKCEKPEVVICGQRYRSIVYGRDPRPVRVTTTTVATTVTTEEPHASFGRGFLGSGRDAWIPGAGADADESSSVPKGHKIVLHDFGSKGNDSSESFLVKIILSNRRKIEKTSILGRNGTHNHIVIEEDVSKEKEDVKGVSTGGAVATPAPVPMAANHHGATTESEYYDDDITTARVTAVPTQPKKLPVTTESEYYEDDTTTVRFTVTHARAHTKKIETTTEEYSDEVVETTTTRPLATSPHSHPHTVTVHQTPPTPITTTAHVHLGPHKKIETTTEEYSDEVVETTTTRPLTTSPHSHPHTMTVHQTPPTLITTTAHVHLGPHKKIETTTEEYSDEVVEITTTKASSAKQILSPVIPVPTVTNSPNSYQQITTVQHTPPPIVSNNIETTTGTSQDNNEKRTSESDKGNKEPFNPKSIKSRDKEAKDFDDELDSYYFYETQENFEKDIKGSELNSSLTQNENSTSESEIGTEQAFNPKSIKPNATEPKDFDVVYDYYYYYETPDNFSNGSTRFGSDFENDYGYAANSFESHIAGTLSPKKVAP